MIQYHYSKSGMRQDGRNSNTGVRHEKPHLSVKTVIPMATQKKCTSYTVFFFKKNYTSLYLHETLDTLCNMFKNISSNGQGIKSVELTARIGRKLMNNVCHGCQEITKYF
jgi:hypothetical protein